MVQVENQYNEQKSIDLQIKIFESRQEHLWQIALGIVLYRHQVRRGDHFDLEQPDGSLMKQVPGMQEIVGHSHQCRFDMCEVGNLRDPVSGQALRKRMEVLSTSDDLHRCLHRRFCSGSHQHQPIAGQTMVGQTRMSLTEFTEAYPKRFARQVARIICHDQSHPTLVGELASAENQESEHPTKKRRLGQKMSAATIAQRFQSINWQTVLKLADSVAPRVGTMVMENGPLVDQVKAMCPNHTVKHVVLCRGTDRYVGPNKTMFPGEAPLRRMVCIRRRVGGIYVDEEWEPWERLTYKGLRRKSTAARVSLTVFAQAKIPDAMPDASSADAPISAGRVHGIDMPDDQASKRHRADVPEVQQQSHHNITDNHNLHNHNSNNLQTPTHDMTIPNLPEPMKLQAQTGEESSSQNSESSAIKTTGEDRTMIDLVSNKHGPKFLALSSSDQAWLLKIHRNLGHPGSPKLVDFCRQLKCPEQILQAIPDLQCSTCKELQMPKAARPGAIHEHGDFGDVISMDGITWTNQKGDQFHFYHFIDQSTLYHTAICSASRTSQQATQALLQGWVQWAGAPKLLVMDAATEFNSEEFGQFLQRFGIKGKTCATEGHWQNSRVERHGGILQMMLNKMDHEEGICNYNQLAIALAHATTTKNQWSKYRGYPPEMLVFGKGSKMVGSVVSDEETASHHAALSPTAEGVKFREELAARDRARRAFVAIDNDQVLRRALTSRSRPTRGQYSPGDWVMLWKRRGEAEGHWEGPMQVIIQEANRVVWVTKGTKLYRAAPEHIRPLSAVEEWHHGQPGSTDAAEPSSIVPHHGGTQFHNMPTVNSNDPNSENQVTIPNNNPSPEQPNNHHNLNNSRDNGDSEYEPESAPSAPASTRHASERPSEPKDSQENSPWTEEAINAPVEVPVPEADDLFMEHEDCFTLVDDMAWKFEVNISQCDVDRWRQESDPHEMSFLVSAAKRQRSEVKMSQLSSAEKELFQQAKQKEIESWLSTETVAKVLRHQIPEENILRCRWILTWKPVDDAKADQPKHVPKARLVVLGYEDPLVHEIPRDSPTMPKLSRMLILQLAASKGWDIESFDIKTAFLRGQEQGDRILGIEPTAELREKMKMRPNEVLRLLKGAYGRVDAPYLWFMELKRGLESLGFTPSPFDPCAFILVENPKSGMTDGIVGVHVDDGLCCGSEFFQRRLQALADMFPFGSHKKRNFTFTGLRIEQQPDNSIHINQTQYINDIQPISIPRTRRVHPDEPVTDDERQSLRGLIGSLQYAAVNSRPDLCSRLGYLQSHINKAKVSTLTEANKTLHEAKVHSNVTIKIQPIKTEDLRFAAFSDASFASEKVQDSHQGMVIMACHRLLGQHAFLGQTILGMDSWHQIAMETSW